MLFTTGTYRYTCPGMGSGNVTVVPAKHRIPFCRQCSIGGGEGESRPEHRINVGDVVEWSVAAQELGQNCTVIIQDLLRNNQSKRNDFFLLSEDALFLQKCQKFHLFH